MVRETPDNHADWIQLFKEEVPDNWRQELQTLLFGMKPETVSLLNDGPSSLSESWHLMALKRRYCEVKGIIANPDNAWIEEERLRKEREEQEDREIEELFAELANE